MKILTWFRSHNSFTTSKKLVCLDSGFIDENNTVNCNEAENIGARIQKLLDNEVFASCSFKRKDQITKLQRLYSSIMIEKTCGDIDQFVFVDPKPEVNTENCVCHELAPYPTFLIY